MKQLDLRILEVQIRVRCPDPYSFNLLSLGYDAFLSPLDNIDLDYSIVRQHGSTYQIHLQGSEPETALNDYELLYLFDKSLTIELQKLQRKLLFLHAGAVEYEGRACLLVAPSGSGKSTTTWALINNGFRYMSDELAPIDPDTMQVHLYPHALNLKATPPDPFKLPAGTLYTEHTIHLPTSLFSNGISRQPSLLSTIFFLRYDSEANDPLLSQVTTGEASARIYSNALNLLAHSSYGLDSVIKIAANSDCLELISCDLQKTCDLIKFRLQHP